VDFGEHGKGHRDCNDDNHCKGIGSSKWGNLVPSETRQSPYVAAIATVAFRAFSVSSSNLISIAYGNGGPNCYNIGKKKSSIDGN
jgi:hypothetical protein